MNDDELYKLVGVERCYVTMYEYGYRMATFARCMYSTTVLR